MSQAIKTYLTVNADATTFIDAVNIDAEMLLSNRFIVHTGVSVAKTIALCKNNTGIICERFYASTHISRKAWNYWEGAENAELENAGVMTLKHKQLGLYIVF